MQELADILADPDIVKTGVGLRDDIKAIKKLIPFTEGNFVDLAEVAKQKKIVNFGLRALTAIFLDKRLSKNSKVSNWERQQLTPAQIAYAACDAVVGFQIYMKLCK
jgi:ribonuclease D